MTTSIDYLVVLNSNESPVLFKSYHRPTSNESDLECEEDLGIQLHCYASLDFLEEKLAEKSEEFVGKIYTIYNSQGEFSIYAFVTVTNIKILAIFKEGDNCSQVEEAEVRNFMVNVYRLYKKQLFQAFSVFEATGKFGKRFYEKLDAYVEQTKFKILGDKK